MSIEQWGGNEPLQGRVRRVEPSGLMKVSALGVEEQRVNVIIDFAEGEKSTGIGDGYRVEVRIVTWRDPAALKVPVGSLFRRGEDWATFVVDNGRARLQPVQFGQRSDREAQVVNGLSERQTVVSFRPIHSRTVGEWPFALSSSVLSAAVPKGRPGLRLQQPAPNARFSSRPRAESDTVIYLAN